MSEIAQPHALTTMRCRVGESAAWSARDDCLYSVDIWGCRLWRQTIAGEAQAICFNEMASSVVVAEHGVVVALESHLRAGRFEARSSDDGQGSRPINWEVLPPPAGHAMTDRFNDAIVAPDGSLVIGTMRKSQFGSEPTGTLYRLADGTWTCLASGFFTLNGLAFAPDGKTLFFSDSHAAVRKVWAAPWLGNKLGKRCLFADFAALEGRPDGAAVDIDGGYWVAGVGGGELYRFDPDGRLDRTIALAIDNPTRPAFGGADLKTLFVSSMAERQVRPDPAGLAGATLVLDSGVMGVPLPLLAYHAFAAP